MRNGGVTQSMSSTSAVESYKDPTPSRLQCNWKRGIDDMDCKYMAMASSAQKKREYASREEALADLKKSFLPKLPAHQSDGLIEWRCTETSMEDGCLARAALSTPFRGYPRSASYSASLNCLDKVFFNQNKNDQNEDPICAEKENAPFNCRSPRRNANFPPPLPSLATKSYSVMLQPIRSKGRFVLQEVKVENHTAFKPIRKEGRLTLHLIRRPAKSVEENCAKKDGSKSESDCLQCKGKRRAATAGPIGSVEPDMTKKDVQRTLGMAMAASALRRASQSFAEEKVAPQPDSPARPIGQALDYPSPANRVRPDKLFIAGHAKPFDYKWIAVAIATSFPQHHALLQISLFSNMRNSDFLHKCRFNGLEDDPISHCLSSQVA